MGYIGKKQCVNCKKIIIVRTTQQRFCKKCKKINRNEWTKEYLKNKINHQKHIKMCENWRLKNLDKKRINQLKYSKKHPIKIKAHQLSQTIPLNNNCDICESRNNLERHHWDYNKPLLINTLCKQCHNIQHIKHFTGGI